MLRSTRHHFPDASHLLIADADWRPDLATINMSDLDFHHNTFQFLIWDHSGHTSRLAGWLLRNDGRLRFKYRYRGGVSSATPPHPRGPSIKADDATSTPSADSLSSGVISVRRIFRCCRTAFLREVFPAGVVCLSSMIWRTRIREVQHGDAVRPTVPSMGRDSCPGYTRYWIHPP